MFLVRDLYVFLYVVLFFNDTATTDIYTDLHTRSLHVALPIFHMYVISVIEALEDGDRDDVAVGFFESASDKQLVSFIGSETGRRMVDRLYDERSEEHTSELQSLMRISYAVFCLNKKQ